MKLEHPPSFYQSPCQHRSSHEAFLFRGPNQQYNIIKSSIDYIDVSVEGQSRIRYNIRIIRYGTMKFGFLAAIKTIAPWCNEFAK